MQLEDYFDFLAPGDIRVKGTRIGIETILYPHLQGGEAAEVIAQRYPALTLEQVCATITYFLQNREAVQAYLDDWIAHGVHMREEQERNLPPVLLRLRKLRAEQEAAGALHGNVDARLSAIQFLLDENVDPALRDALALLSPEALVRMVGDPQVPVRGAKDPDILDWCVRYDFSLVTWNRVSMPVHLDEIWSSGRSTPAVFVLHPRMTIGQIAEDLSTVWGASEAEEYRDRIIHLPASE